MSISVRNDSLYKFANPYFDDIQEENTWGISDPPDPVERDDDRFHLLVEGERIDLLAYTLLGDPRYFWVILHYNNIPNAIDLEKWVGKELRVPSKTTLEKVYLNASEFTSDS